MRKLLLAISVLLIAQTQAWKRSLDHISVTDDALASSLRWMIDNPSFAHPQPLSRSALPHLIAKVQASVDRSLDQLQPIRLKGLHSTQEGGCFQCTSACFSESCKHCHSFSHTREYGVQKDFCEGGKNKREPTFRGSSVYSCSNCTCCTYIPLGSCDYGTEKCEVPPEKALCASLHDTLTNQFSSPRCSQLLRDLHHGNFTKACASVCFDTFLEAYEQLLTNNCLDEDALSSENFRRLACEPVCEAPEQCFEQSYKYATQLMGNSECSHLLTNPIGGQGLPPSLCKSKCFSDFIHAYRDLYSSGCFVCEEKVLSPEAIEQTYCPLAGYFAPTLNNASLPVCNHLVHDRLIPLLRSSECSEVNRAFDENDLSGVCNTQCFRDQVIIYAELYTASCMINPASPPPHDFERFVCTFDKTEARSEKPLARVHATIRIPLSSVTVEQFTSESDEMIAHVIAKVAHVSKSRVRILAITDGIDVEFEILIPPDAAESTFSLVQSALSGFSFKDTLDTHLRAKNASFAVPSVEVVTPVSMNIVEQCSEVEHDTGFYCLGIDGCPTSHVGFECCVSLLEAIQSGCSSGKSCGVTMEHLFESQCSEFSSILYDIANFFESIAPPASSSPSPSPSHPPSSSSRPKPSREQLHMPHRLVLGGPSAPTPAQPYWGVRQHCRGSGPSTVCTCAYGYTGPNCSIHAFENCTEQCNDHAYGCFNGKCLCDAGFDGPSCSFVSGCRELNYCSGHGVCACNSTNSACRCRCSHGYAGQTCSIVDFRCPKSCSNHGTCEQNGNCSCHAGWGGQDCSIPLKSCPLNCSGGGVCNPVTGNCTCSKGRRGRWCELVDVPEVKNACKDLCSGRGHCIVETGVCMCAVGYSGYRCEINLHAKNCDDRKNCSGNGICNQKTGECDCKEGFLGVACDEIKGCPNSCSGNGHCVGSPENSVCKCKMAFDGLDCSISRCSVDQNGHVCGGKGVCEKKHGLFVCSCADGFEGPLCTPKPIPPPSPQSPVDSAGNPIAHSKPPCGGNNCLDNGVCNSAGLCDCFEGYGGEDCSVDMKPNDRRKNDIKLSSTY